ncbi:TonB-dependent receptor [Mucilaginibacter sp. UR6-1]|uniref:TonB-dependent receptor plug domain-containing protein n=1 Tax=Mucilaginibacter sp. UR6-1 TaxID=1435643 RepID=UPI001E59D3FC|nr:TonB-dependent receptor [Mucilaginibacter sp. UR6-1]MCC8408046.1 TonB-dependent receptor [Mucilaginibacter sp. UR6-1]
MLITISYVLSSARFIKRAGMLCIFSLSAGTAFSQTDTTKTIKQVNIQGITMPALQTTLPVQSVTSANFAQYSAFNVADAVRNFSGVNVRDYGGIGGLKTVSVRSMGANYTNVLYDGILLNDAQTGQIDLGRFNLLNLKEIILYIAQPVNICLPARSYSNSAVLSLVTAQPELTIEKPYQVIAGMRTGSFGLINPYLQWQQRLNNKWSFVLNGYTQNANGNYRFKDNFGGRDTIGKRVNSEVSAQQIDGGVYYSKNDSSKFRLQFNYNNANRGLPGPVILNAVYQDQHLTNQDAFIQAAYERIWKNSLHLLLSTKASHNYQHYTDASFLNNNGGANEHYTQREIYQSAALAYKPVKNWEISYAADISLADIDIDVFRYAYPTRLSLYNMLASNLSLGSFFLQGSLLNTYINDNTQTPVAARSRSAFTPTFILNYKVINNNELTLRAFYKNLYRYPNLSEQYYYAIQPRALKPEQARQYNVGAVYNKNFNSAIQYLTLSTDAYYYNVDNKIFTFPGRSAEIISVRNLGKVDIRGLDANIKTGFTPLFGWQGSFSAAYTYQRAIDISSPGDSFYKDQIPYTPKHTLALNVGLKHRAAGIYFNHILSSSRYYSSNNSPQYYVPGYNVSDASVTYDFKLYGQKIHTSAEVNNLFNKNYAIVDSYPMPPRSLRLTLQLTI